MHEQIKAFTLNGEMADGNFIEERARLIKHVEDQMRDCGYAPSVELEPQLTRHYRPSTETYDFELTVYGVEVGKDKSWSISGMTNGKVISRHTPLAR